MIEEVPKKKKNIFLLTTIVTIFAVAGQIIFNYIIREGFEPIESVVFAVFFWVTFFFVHRLSARK